MAPLLPILGARMAGVDAQWLSVLQLLPTVLLIVAAFLLLDIALSAIVPGAYDNASGVAAVLSAAEELAAEPVANLDLWLLLTGAEECLNEGMRAWVRAHKPGLDPERTVILNVDSVSYGSVHYELSEGPVINHPFDPELIELCEALGTAEPGEPAARPVRSPVTTDAIAARIRGLRAITITSLDDGLPPPWYHAHEDTPERVNPGAITRATEFVVGLARLLDREAGRRAEPAGRGANPVV
jgi:aminopeptidase YwaD